MISDKQLLKQFNEHKDEAFRSLASQKEAARQAYDFYAGNEMTYKTGASQDDKKMVNVNQVKPFIDSVQGFLIQNRRNAVYHAAIWDNDEQRQKSGYINRMSQYFRDNANADQVESDQDRDMLICGIGATDTNLTYNDYDATTDPNGEIVKECIPIIYEAWWDPAAKAKNLTDASYVFRAKTFHLEAAKDLFDRPEQDFTTVMQDSRDGGKFFDSQQNATISVELDKVNKDMVNVYYYQWCEINKFYRIKNPLPQILEVNPDGAIAIMQILEGLKAQRINITHNRRESQEDIFDFKPDSEILIVPSNLKEPVRNVFLQFGIDLDFEEGKRKEFFTGIISGEKVFTKYKNIDQTGFSIKFKTGFYDINNALWFGMVRSLQTPALFVGKLTTETLNIISASAKPGVLYETGAVENPDGFEKKYAINGSAIEVEDGAISGGKIRDKQVMTNISGYADMLAFFQQGFNNALGIGSGFFGAVESKEETGILQRQRVKRTISILANYFDSVTLYQKLEAKSFLPLMRALAEESADRLLMITGENGVVSFERFGADEFADRYEVTVGEAPDTDTAKQDAIDATVALADRLLASQDPNERSKGTQIATLVYDLLPGVPNDVKRKVEAIMMDPEPTPEQIQQQQQEQQLRQQAQMLELEEKQVDIASKQADINQSEAKVRESESKTIKNLSEGRKVDTETEIMEEGGIQDYSTTNII